MVWKNGKGNPYGDWAREPLPVLIVPEPDTTENVASFAPVHVHRFLDYLDGTPLITENELPGWDSAGSAHAPAGGVSVGGRHFQGGQFIPGHVMKQATHEERESVEKGQSNLNPTAPTTRPGFFGKLLGKTGEKAGTPAIAPPPPDVHDKISQLVYDKKYKEAWHAIPGDPVVDKSGTEWKNAGSGGRWLSRDKKGNITEPDFSRYKAAEAGIHDAKDRPAGKEIPLAHPADPKAFKSATSLPEPNSDPLIKSVNAAVSIHGRPELTTQEQHALLMYSTLSYRSMNEGLRSGNPWEHEGRRQEYEQIQSAMSKAAPLAAPITVYRTGQPKRDMSEADRAEFYKRLHDAAATGGTVTIPGFSSTTTEASLSNPKADLLMRIEARHGLDMRPYSDHPKEYEFLLNHNSTFKVKSVTQDGERTIVHLEQVLTGPGHDHEPAHIPTHNREYDSADKFTDDDVSTWVFSGQSTAVVNEKDATGHDHKGKGPGGGQFAKGGGGGEASGDTYTDTAKKPSEGHPPTPAPAAGSGHATHPAAGAHGDKAASTATPTTPHTGADAAKAGDASAGKSSNQSKPLSDGSETAVKSAHKNADKNADKALDELVGHKDWTGPKDKEVVRKALLDAYDKAEVTHNTNAYGLAAMCVGGGLKPAALTGTRTKDYMKERDKEEGRSLGAPADTLPTERPVYTAPNFAGKVSGAAGVYGGCAISLNKDALAGRTTMHHRDTFDKETNPGVLGTHENPVAALARNQAALKAAGFGDKGGPPTVPGSYCDTQVWGGGMKLDKTTVKEIRIPSTATVDPNAAIIKSHCEKEGIPLTVYHHETGKAMSWDEAAAQHTPPAKKAGFFSRVFGGKK